MKKTLFFLAIAAIFATGCSKNDDSFNPDEKIIQESKDTVTFTLSANILTFYDWNKYYSNSYIVRVSLDNGIDSEFFQVDLNPGTSITLRGDNANRLIGKEVLVYPELNVFYVYDWTPEIIRSEYFKTHFNPEPQRFIVEKNKSYYLHFDITFDPL